MQEQIINYHKAQLIESELEIKRLDRQINIYSFLRLFALAFALIIFYQCIKYEQIWLSILTVLLFILGFSWLVSKQNAFQKLKKYFLALSDVHANELNSIDRKGNLYSDGSKFADDLHPYSSDLDIFGKSSLFEMINRCATAPGNKILASWLSEPSSPSSIRERQEALVELNSKLKWKHHFQAVLLFANSTSEDKVKDLFRYLDAKAEDSPSWIKSYVKIIPWLFLSLSIAAFFLPYLSLALIFIIVFNFFLTQSFNARIQKTDSIIGKMSDILNYFSEAIAAIKNEQWATTLTNNLASEFQSNDKAKFSEQIRFFSLLISHLTLGLTSIGILLNTTILWNIRQIFAIESWKMQNHANLKHAFELIANFEALISLSSLNTNNPDWCFATIHEGEFYTFNAIEIGHPLIASQIRVANNYSLKDELKIDIITGSNMAGKSTFLRTLGINTVLALSGAPSCAKELTLSKMLVFSYMRIRDSLNESTSTFKAELDRLQALLKILEGSGKVFFLIDEMLRGTNSIDKYLGSKAVIERLIAQNGVGIVATHDLQIADLEEKYPNYIRNFYFDIQVEGEDMNFDYKLKDGACKTFNASLLLKRIGIYPEKE
jgi:DNA mismatch repair ATPase MutS